jgi:nucleotide-binding universal stress UspA family protein
MTRAPRSVIVAVTPSGHGRDAIAFADALAGALGAELVLAGIVPLAAPDGCSGGVSDAIMPVRRVEQERLMERLVAERLEEVSGRLTSGVRARSVVTWGPVAEALTATAREEDADLVVVPMRREGSLGHLVHDHVDRYVLHHSEVPVLVVPEAPPEARR